MITVADQVTRAKVAVAASAVATAAVLTPAIAAEAQPVTVPSLPASPLADVFGSDPIQGPFAFSTETPWWWFGDSPHPNPHLISFAPLAISANTILEFQPLALVPGFLQPIAKPLLNLVPQFSVCVAGLGVSVGPYARLSVKSSAC